MVVKFGSGSDSYFDKIPIVVRRCGITRDVESRLVVTLRNCSLYMTYINLGYKSN